MCATYCIHWQMEDKNVLKAQVSMTELSEDEDLQAAEEVWGIGFLSISLSLCFIIPLFLTYFCFVLQTRIRTLMTSMASMTTEEVLNFFRMKRLNISTVSHSLWSGIVQGCGAVLIFVLWNVNTFWSWDPASFKVFIFINWKAEQKHIWCYFSVGGGPQTVNLPLQTINQPISVSC